MHRVRRKKRGNSPERAWDKALFEEELVSGGFFSEEQKYECVDILVKKAAERAADTMLDGIESGVIRLDSSYYGRKKSGKGKYVPQFLDESNLEQFFEKLRYVSDPVLKKYGGIEGIQQWTYKCTLDEIPEFRKKENGRMRMLAQKAFGREIKQSFREIAGKKLTDDVILEHLLVNPRYRELASRKLDEIAAERELLSFIEEGMPSDYTKLFPRARRMKREFYLHIGPTNSGKTHDALEDLKKAKSGVYLAPLRLMAYEQYEAMIDAGLECHMLTGEESYGSPESSHVSSTVEMADYAARYEVGVIDEAQMLSDPDRGYAWTAAILGLRAERIHVCAAPYARKIIERLVALCGDTCTICEHERLVPIAAVREPVRFPGGVQPGDALIVFSRRSVHSVAGLLREQGISCSIIYGALPYDVRHEEVRKFNDRETDVVVATDAIGMGMNLPVRRVVFVEDYKFDGRDSRVLKPEEVQQIAGRAGRYGIYDLGLYGSLEGNEDMEELYNAPVDDIEEAVVTIPNDILLFDTRVSVILEKWSEIPVQKGFIKANVRREIDLAKRLEHISDDKKLICEFINLKFDEESFRLLELWEDCFCRVMLGEGLDVMLDEVGARSDMAGLELLYREYDLLYSCVSRFEPQSELISVIEKKRSEITDRLIVLLQDQHFERRRCKRCGRSLPFGFRYSVCERCHRERRWDRHG